MNEKIEQILELVEKELLKAMYKFDPFINAHEGYAVLLEEVDELWDVVKLNQKNPRRQGWLKEEAIQVAAMAVRFLHGVCGDD